MAIPHATLAISYSYKLAVLLLPALFIATCELVVLVAASKYYSYLVSVTDSERYAGH